MSHTVLPTPSTLPGEFSSLIRHLYDPSFSSRNFAACSSSSDSGGNSSIQSSMSNKDHRGPSHPTPHETLSNAGANLRLPGGSGAAVVAPREVQCSLSLLQPLNSKGGETDFSDHRDKNSDAFMTSFVSDSKCMFDHKSQPPSPAVLDPVLSLPPVVCTATMRSQPLSSIAEEDITLGNPCCVCVCIRV